MKYYVFCWFTVFRGQIRHSGTWNSLADTEEDAEKRLHRWIHARYPGHRLMIHQRQIIRC